MSIRQADFGLFPGRSEQAEIRMLKQSLIAFPTGLRSRKTESLAGTTALFGRL